MPDTASRMLKIHFSAFKFFLHALPYITVTFLRKISSKTNMTEQNARFPAFADKFNLN
jgi:hypothetical protein